MVAWIFAFFLSLGSAFAQYDFAPHGALPSSQKAKIPFPLKKSSVVVDPHIDEVVTPSGLKAWLIETKDLEVVSIAFMVRGAGSKVDPKDKQGLVQLFVAMIDEGAGPYAAEQFKKFLLTHNILLTVTPAPDHLTFHIRCPTASLDKAFEALSLILYKLNLKEKDLKKIRDQLFIHYRQLSQNEKTQALELLGEILFKGHPYSQTIQDCIRDLPKISAEDIRTYVKEYITQDRILIAACGNISKDVLRDKIEALLEALPAKSQAPTIPDIKLLEASSITHRFLEIPQSFILFAHPGIKRSDLHYYAMDLAMNILGSGEFGSRLMQVIREQKGLVYGIEAGLDMSEHVQLIKGSASTRHKTVDEVIRLIKDEWKNFIKKGVTEEELDKAKSRLIGLFPLRVTNTSAITHMLLSIQYHHLGIDFLKKRTHLIQSVTPSEVNELLKERLLPEKLLFFVIGKEETAPESQKKLKEGA